MLSPEIIAVIATKVSARPEQVSKAVELFDGGATIPFVARYRKDATGNLNEVKLEGIAAENQAFTALEQRRAAVLKNIEKAGALTDELRAAIEACLDKNRLEDLYLPFKKKRRTKASVAREQGLGPLADRIWAQDPAEPPLEETAQGFLAPDKGLTTAEEVLAGARHILSERISEDSEARTLIRDRMLADAKVSSKSTKLSEGKKTKFNTYYEFSEAVQKIPSHRMLAILRGFKDGLLRMELSFDDAAMLATLVERCVRESESVCAPQLRLAVEDAYARLMRPSIETEVIGVARQRADEHAIRVFRENARNLLLAPPAGRMISLGLDPGLRTGSKLAVTNSEGDVLEHATIFPEDSEEKRSAAEAAVVGLLQKHEVRAVAVGSGTGSREAMKFMREVLAKLEGVKPVCVLVNEAGASVYSASKLAREEFPDLDVTIRGAVSIARRLQDPLSELVKVEPRSIGVGQYQHDVNQKQLREGLHQTVVSCVNRVGVDLNTASVPLLRYVSGVQYGTAQNIVTFRSEKGGFKSREQLLEVAGVGPKVYEQCAGFMRITDGDNALDSTAIHPESYPVVEQIAASAGVASGELLRNREVIDKLDLDALVTGELGKAALTDIREELVRPARDPRRQFRAPRFLEGVEEIKDLEKGVETEGVVTNVTDFGAFVDIGVHQDGLVHLSELANRFVRDPRQVVRVGEVVRVKVIEVDPAAPRISLSIKALQAPAKKRASRSKPAERSDEKTGDRESRSRRPRSSERSSRRDNDSSRRNKGKRSGKSDRGGARSGSKPKVHQSGPEAPLNTQLADQLESLKEQLSP